MKKIDFSKPLRTSISDLPVEVLARNLTLVRWANQNGRSMSAAVDEAGVVQNTDTWSSVSFAIENVPEEPQDYILLFKSLNPPHNWMVNTRGAVLERYTREEAMKYVAREPERYMLSKVEE